ncbi:MAG: hypothetical protein J0L60_07240 [Ignavibacteria bacterium]|nr:hypothetical protein [Ignavibacteria bacterium]
MKLVYLFLPLLFLFTNTIFSQQKVETNFEVKDQKIYIYYQFDGDPEDKYEIEVKLKRGHNPEFSYEPLELKGDIGKGYFAKKKCTIIWELKESETQQFADGDDFYFEVVVDESKSKLWLYLLGGGVIVSGGIAAILLGMPRNDPPSETKLPMPPARP